MKLFVIENWKCLNDNINELNCSFWMFCWITLMRSGCVISDDDWFKEHIFWIFNDDSVYELKLSVTIFKVNYELIILRAMLIVIWILVFWSNFNFHVVASSSFLLNTVGYSCSWNSCSWKIILFHYPFIVSLLDSKTWCDLDTLWNPFDSRHLYD